jgi:hypothetical protein
MEVINQLKDKIYAPEIYEGLQIPSQLIFCVLFGEQAPKERLGYEDTTHAIHPSGAAKISRDPAADCQ